MNDESEEVDFESTDEMGDMGAAKAKLAKLRLVLKEAQAKRDEYLDGWQRSKADSVNVRREALASSERASARAQESLILDLIPALDSFDMATGSASWESVDDAWKSGMDQVKNQLLGVLSRYGVERYGKVGDKFDLNRHDPIQEVDDVAGEPGDIVKLLLYGYKVGDRIIRPAQVIIKG